MPSDRQDDRQDDTEEEAPRHWEVPPVGALLGSLRAKASTEAFNSVPQLTGLNGLNGLEGPGAPTGLTGPSLYLNIGEVQTETDNHPQPVYLQCTGEQDDYACTLRIPLGRIEMRFAPCDFPDLSGDELRALLEKAQAALPEIRALATADLLLRRHGELLYQGLFSSQQLRLRRADVAPFAARHPSCRRAVKLIDAVLTMERESSPF